MVFLAPADLAEARTLVQAIERQLPGIVTTTGSGDSFLFYDPDGVTRPDQRFPFCTLVTADRYDAASDLDRDPAAYRVNLGVDRASYEELFGPAPREAVGTEVLDTGFDYTALDTLLPHPFYAPLHWLCVVNPGEGTRAAAGRAPGTGARPGQAPVRQPAPTPGLAPDRHACRRVSVVRRRSAAVHQPQHRQNGCPAGSA